MRRILAAATLLVACLAPGRARADTPATTNCTMGTLQMTLGLDIAKTDGTFNPINTTQIQTVFGLAECQCYDPAKYDIMVRAFVTAPLAMGSMENYEVWAGSGCDQSINRSGNPPACKKIDDSALTTNFFQYLQGSGQTPRQRVPVLPLASPNTTSTAMCDNVAVSNSLYLLYYQQFNNPDDVCSISLPVHTTPPTPPSLDDAGSGDGAITLSWTAPITGGSNVIPRSYQVLCRDANGNPAPAAGGPFDQGYSVCLNGNLRRRRLQTGGNATSTGTDGGVVTTTGDGGMGGGEGQPLGGSAEGLSPDNTGDDAGSATSDGGATGEDPRVTFGGLDPGYICSAVLPPTTTSLRIAGLTNGTSYTFTVVGIDDYGNVAASRVLRGTPQPTEDLYRRLRDKGLASQGFCFVATAAYGSYESPFVQVLRDFRDRVLLEHAWGAAFVDWYYRHSPPAAAYIAEHDGLRALTRVALWPVIAVALLWLHLAPWQDALLVALLVALWAIRRANRRPRAAATAERRPARCPV